MRHRQGFAPHRPSITRRRQARTRSTRVTSIKAALDEFLVAPSGDNGYSNGELVVRHLGAKGIDLVDPPSFDAASLRYEKKIGSFREAFAACWNGKRDWVDFDIQTLRACDDLGRLQLPERVERVIAEREEAEERAAIVNESQFSDREEGFTDEAVEAPPLELLRRRRRKTTRKRRARTVATTRKRTARTGRRKAARSCKPLELEYRRAKAAYHRAGNKLLRARSSCEE